MSKMVKHLWSNILLSKQNENQVASTTGSVTLYSAFPQPEFSQSEHFTITTLEHNNSLLIIIGYTLSIPCRLSSLPLTTMIPACAAPVFRWNGHSRRKVNIRIQIQRLKSYSTGPLLRQTGNRQHCSDTNWSWSWQQQDLQLHLHSISEASSTGEVIRTSAHDLQPCESSWH